MRSLLEGDGEILIIGRLTSSSNRASMNRCYPMCVRRGPSPPTDEPAKEYKHNNSTMEGITHELFNDTPSTCASRTLHSLDDCVLGTRGGRDMSAFLPILLDWLQQYG